jgi:hypothetical protein
MVLEITYQKSQEIIDQNLEIFKSGYDKENEEST